MRQLIVLSWIALTGMHLSSCKPNGCPSAFDWQGHRGARGLAPENTVPAFLKALEYPVTTLELDVVVSGDGKVVVSHEPFMAAQICRRPDGSPIPEEEETAYNLYTMPYDSIRQYDCGSLEHPGFPDQALQQVSKPLLSEVLAEAERYCERTGRQRPRYNIELKSMREWYDQYVPRPEKFLGLVMEVVQRGGVAERVSIQSFDPMVLQALSRLYPEVESVFLISSAAPLSRQLSELGMQPDVYSPNYRLLTAEVVRQAQAQDMRVIPWTVNEVAAMQSLIEMGVDGIITDYPDRIEAVEGAR
jgi:glycerophosphoryl diester phosphodiesterase